MNTQKAAECSRIFDNFTTSSCRKINYLLLHQFQMTGKLVASNCLFVKSVCVLGQDYIICLPCVLWFVLSFNILRALISLYIFFNLQNNSKELYVA